MFVTGATQAEVLGDIRAYLPEHFLLVPGVGFQGGSLDAVSKAVLLPDAGLLVNVSRAILYAGEKEDFATEAGIIAKQYQVEMQSLLTTNR
jgi:orotidine-5'-phosphate decarboxylase